MLFAQQATPTLWNFMKKNWHIPEFAKIAKILQHVSFSIYGINCERDVCSTGKGKWSRRITDRRFLNSSLAAKRFSMSFSICSFWSSSRWHLSSSICGWSWLIDRAWCGPRWLKGVPQRIRLCDYGQCWNNGCSFESGGLVRFLSHTGDYTSCNVLNNLR